MLHMSSGRLNAWSVCELYSYHIFIFDCSLYCEECFFLGHLEGFGFSVHSANCFACAILSSRCLLLQVNLAAAADACCFHLTLQQALRSILKDPLNLCCSLLSKLVGFLFVIPPLFLFWVLFCSVLPFSDVNFVYLTVEEKIEPTFVPYFWKLSFCDFFFFLYSRH